MAKISVIIPCYNVAPWVERCLDSILNQTLQDIEVICIDDKSTDETALILKRIAANDNRVKLVLLEKNSGAGAARNSGLKIAAGEYISFLDPDDYIDLDFYEKLYFKAKEEKTDIVKACLWQTNKKEPEHYLNTLIKKGIAWFYGEYTTAIYKHSFLKEHNISFPVDVITGEDSVFLTNVVIYKPTISLIENTFYRYYRRDGSLDSQVLSHKKALSRLKMVNHKINLIKTAKLSPQEFNLFVNAQIISQIKVLMEHKFELEEDIDMIWTILHNLNNQFGLHDEFKNSFGKKIVSCLTSRNFIEKCNRYYFGKKKRVYLFFILPFILILSYRNVTWINFLKFVPVLKIKRNKFNNKSKFYLFGLLPLLKIKG